MKESLQIAKQELIERWIKAFDEMDEFLVYEKKTVKIRFSETYRFDLSTYGNGKIKMGGKMFDKIPDEGQNFHEYGFDKNNFPTITRARHSWNKIDWIGFFKKANDRIEYLEFCLNTKIPSCVQQIFLQNKRKVSYKSLIINGGGSGAFYKDSPKEQLAVKITTDDHSLISVIEEYEYKDSRISKAFGVANTPGIGEYLFQDIYRYEEDGELNEIKRFFENWPSQIVYIKPSKKTLISLMNELAEKFCDYLIELLSKYEFESPLFSVQICYSYCDNFWPSLSIISEETRENAIRNKTDLLFFSSEFLELNQSNAPAQLKEIFAEFIQRISGKENWKAGRKMLQKTAKLMTQSKLKGKLAVSNDFNVFAIDWTLVENIEELLIKSGTAKRKVSEWKRLKWF